MTSRAAASAPLTRDEVLALAQARATTNVENLARAMGCGIQGVYEAIAHGTWTATRVLRVGNRILIPTQDICDLLGIAPEAPMSDTAAPETTATSADEAVPSASIRRGPRLPDRRERSSPSRAERQDDRAVPPASPRES